MFRAVKNIMTLCYLIWYRKIIIVDVRSFSFVPRLLGFFFVQKYTQREPPLEQVVTDCSKLQLKRDFDLSIKPPKIDHEQKRFWHFSCQTKFTDHVQGDL